MIRASTKAVIERLTYVVHQTTVKYLQEPDHALRAEDNGLKVVNDILFSAKHWLKEFGKLFVEVGNSDDIVAKTYSQVPFTWLEFQSGGHGVFMLTQKKLEKYF